MGEDLEPPLAGDYYEVAKVTPFTASTEGAYMIAQFPCTKYVTLWGDWRKLLKQLDWGKVAPLAVKGLMPPVTFQDIPRLPPTKTVCVTAGIVNSKVYQTSNGSIDKVLIVDAQGIMMNVTRWMDRANQELFRSVVDALAENETKRFVVFGVRVDIYQGVVSLKCHGASSLFFVGGKDVGQGVPAGPRRVRLLEQMLLRTSLSTAEQVKSTFTGTLARALSCEMLVDVCGACYTDLEHVDADKQGGTCVPCAKVVAASRVPKLELLYTYNDAQLCATAYGTTLITAFFNETDPASEIHKGKVHVRHIAREACRHD